MPNNAQNLHHAEFLWQTADERVAELDHAARIVQPVPARLQQQLERCREDVEHAKQQCLADVLQHQVIRRARRLRARVEVGAFQRHRFGSPAGCGARLRFLLVALALERAQEGGVMCGAPLVRLEVVLDVGQVLLGAVAEPAALVCGVSEAAAERGGL